MNDMDKEQEWQASILKENTKLHHTKSLAYLKEYLKKTPEELIALRQEEGKRFNTRIVLFWNWLQTEKHLSKSTASSYVIGISSFFAYYDLDLKMRGKIPDTTMRLDVNIPTLENLQTMFRLADLQGKTLLSLMRDCPARIGDLVQRVIPQMKKKEFLIESEKEGIVGKIYLTDGTVTLANQLEEAGLLLPTTKRGLSLMLERMCKTSGVPPFSAHMMRKIFFTQACNLNINRDHIRVLVFKSVAKDLLAYLLNKAELRQSWEQVISALPLEKVNGKASQDVVDDIAKALARVIKKEMGYQIQTPDTGIGLLIEESPMETIRRYLES